MIDLDVYSSVRSQKLPQYTALADAILEARDYLNISTALATFGSQLIHPCLFRDNPFIFQGTLSKHRFPIQGKAMAETSWPLLHHFRSFILFQRLT